MNSKILPSVRIMDRKRYFIERNDTIIYDAKPFMNKEVHKVKDLLSKMPGFTIDKSGRVIFNGKEIKHVMINGEDLTGNTYEIITKNLQAGLISKVELVKRFHENRLLSGLEWGDEQAVNLVIDKQHQYKVNAQNTIGITKNFQRKELDGNIISLYRRTSSLVVYDANNHGRKPNGMDASTILNPKEPERFTLPYNQNTPMVSSDVPDNYVRNSNDQGLNLNHSYKMTPQISLKNHISFYSEKGLQNQASIMSFHFPGADRWNYQSRNFNANMLKIVEGGLDVKYDNSKRHTSSYGLQVLGSKATRTNVNILTMPMHDTTHAFIFNNQKMVIAWGNESFKFNTNNVLVNEIKFISSYQNNFLDYISGALKFLPDQLSASSGIRNHAYAHENSLIGGTKLVFKTPRRFIQMGLNIHHQHIFTENTIQDFKSINTIQETMSDAIYRAQKSSVYVSCDEELSKKLLLSWQSSIGYSTVEWRQLRKSGLTGYASTSLNYRNRGFRQTNLHMSVSRGLPNKNMYHASPMLSEQLQWMYGASQISFPVKAHFQFLKTYTDLYKGISLTSTFSIDNSFHNAASSLYQYPLYSISGYQMGKRNRTLSGQFKFQKNIFPLMIKPFIDMQYSNMQQELMLNGRDFKLYTYVSEFQFGMVSYWNTKVNLETSFLSRSSLMQMKQAKENIKTIDLFNKADLKLKCIITKNTYASAYGMILWKPGNFKAFHCMDAYLEHRLSERMLVMLRLHNLFNQKIFIERQSIAYVRQEINTDLLSRYILFSIQFEL